MRKAKLQITPGSVAALAAGRGDVAQEDALKREQPYEVEVEMDQVIPLKFTSKDGQTQESKDTLKVVGMWDDKTVTLKSDTLVERKVYGPPATVNLEVGETAEFRENVMDDHMFWEVKVLSFDLE